MEKSREADGEKKIKGSVMTGYLKYIKKKWGVDGLDDCAKKTGVDLRKLIDDRWYHYMTSVDVLDWMRDTYGIDHCRVAGNKIVTDKGIISFAARIAGIERVLEKGLEEYRNSLNYGDIKIEQKADHATVTLIDVIIGDSDLQTWVGVFEGILEVTKKKGTVEVKSEGINTTFTLKWNS